jgi:hypothetical protein
MGFDWWCPKRNESFERRLAGRFEEALRKEVAERAAMLARLGYGIVTTGSQLRALQPDQEGGTSLADLQVAIAKWGVAFSQGAISPLQLRALLYAGAGAGEFDARTCGDAAVAAAITGQNSSPRRHGDTEAAPIHRVLLRASVSPW